MAKVELAGWLANLIDKGEKVVEAVPEEKTKNNASVVDSVTSLSVSDNLMAGAPPAETTRAAEVEDEYAWFFKKEFFACMPGEAEPVTGEKRKPADSENEDEDDEENDREVQIVGEQLAKGKETQKEKTKAKGHYTCYVCNGIVPKTAFSNRQRKKKLKVRMKCKTCMSEAVGKNAPTEPLSAAQLYKLNKDRFIGF